MKHKLPLWDERMLLVMKYVIANNIRDIGTKTAFMKAIGFSNAANLTQIKTGLQSFRLEHIQAACKLFNLDANYFVDSSCTLMNRGKKSSAMQQLKEAVQAVGIELGRQ
jgi:hypothetical protein